jgi:hypothetical protein
MTTPVLVKSVLDTFEKTFSSRDFRRRLRFFVDSYRSFEGYVNWELAFQFAARYPWPDWTSLRENRYEDGGLADLVFYEKSGDYEPDSSCHVETKLIWDNFNAGKMAQSAHRDFKRLLRYPGSLMLLLGASGNEEKDGLGVRPPLEVIRRAGAAFSAAARRSERVLLDLPVPKGKWYRGPKFAAAIYVVK